MSNSTVFFENEKTNWEVIEDKIQRQIVGFDDSIMMVNVRFEKGGIGALHHHVHTQVTHISEGKFEVTIGNETKVLKKGDSFFIPSDVIHGVVCLEAGTLVDVFSPMREDFIK
mgnify:CR=1 FL=1